MMTGARFFRRIGRTASRCIGIGSAVLWLCACSEPLVETVAEQWDLIDLFCTDCHNDIDLSGDLSLAQLDADHVSKYPEIWEEVIRKLRGDLMPPPGGPRPDAERVAAFVAAVEDYLDASAAERGLEPGRVPVHRLNRTEYATAVARACPPLRRGLAGIGRS